MSEVKVRVVEFGDRPHYQLQWTCPLTGKKKTKSSGVLRTGKKADRDRASKEAAKQEELLASCNYQIPGRVSWDEFRTKYEREVLAHLAPETSKKANATLDLVERMIRPNKLADVTSGIVSEWLTQLQKTRAPATAGIYGRHLRSAMNWAKSVGLIREAPRFKIPRKANGDTMAKGRAICGEEHDRIKLAVGKVVKASHVAAWHALLDGLWYSGLRLGEALRLSWDASADVAVVMVPGSRPVVRFRAAGQKARRDEIWPCPPEFAMMLEATPDEDRTGLVFNVPKRGRGTTGQMTVDRASRAISEFAKKAGVRVDEAIGAAAHDYRRAFGTRWSKRVMPAVLKRLMRHRDIGTTMKFYVDQDAAKIADELWQQFGSGNTSGNIQPQNSVNPAETSN